MRNLPALTVGEVVIEPIVADCGSEGGFGSDEKFVTRPSGKSADGQKLRFGTIAISGVAGASVDLGGRTSGSGAGPVSEDRVPRWASVAAGPAKVWPVFLLLRTTA